MNRRRWIVALAAAFVAVGTASAAIAVTQERSGIASEVFAKTSNDAWEGTATDDWEPVEGAELTVTVEEPATLIIDCAASSLCERLNRRHRCYVRVLVDGRKAQPGRVLFATNPFPEGPNSFRWVRGVSAGEHTVQVEWLGLRAHPAEERSVFAIEAWTLTVLTAQ